LKKCFGANGQAAQTCRRVNGISDAPRAVEALLNFAATNDRVIRLGDDCFGRRRDSVFSDQNRTVQAVAEGGGKFSR
jgi:hypothetical protein